MANITGWGRGTWGEGAWNAPLAVEVTGVTGTTALGSETALPAITVAVTGVAGTTAVGSETVTATETVAVSATGVSGTTSVGSETVVPQCLVSVTNPSRLLSSFNLEHGLTLDGLVNDGQAISSGSDTEDITNTERTQDIVLAAEMDLPSSFSKASCIWETGGTGNGAWFGISEQSGAYFLRFRAGLGTDGSNTTTNSISIAQVAVSSLSQYFDGNTHTVIWAIDRDIGKTEIYIDGQLVAEGQTSDGSSVHWAGSANGAFGVASGTPAGGDSDDGSTQFQSADAFTGTIRSDLRMYKNEFLITQASSTITGTSVVAVTGVEGVSSVGDEATIPQGLFTVSGVVGTSAVGTASAAPQTVVSLTSVVGTTAVGSESITGTTSFSVTGVEGTGQIGDEVAFSNVVIVETGLSATTGLGSVTALPSITFAASSQVGTTGLGTVTVLPSIAFSVTGVAATTSLGTATALPSITFAAAGFAATSSVGDVLAAGGAKVTETALTGTVNIGEEAVSGDANLSVTGVSATTKIDKDDVTTTFTVTVVSGNPSNHPYYNQGSTNKYAIGGSTATADVVLTLTEGQTYRFDQSDSSNGGHPIAIYEDADKTTQYTTGVTTNGTAGSAGAYTEIAVPIGAPTLFYQCTNHALMGAQLNTVSATTLIVTGSAIFAETGLVGTTAVGTATAVIPVIVTTTGVSATSGFNNSVTFDLTTFILPTSVIGTTAVGNLNLYGLIANEVTVSYTEITGATTSYSTTSPSQSPEWAA